MARLIKTTLFCAGIGAGSTAMLGYFGSRKYQDIRCFLLPWTMNSNTSKYWSIRFQDKKLLTYRMIKTETNSDNFSEEDLEWVLSHRTVDPTEPVISHSGTKNNQEGPYTDFFKNRQQILVEDQFWGTQTHIWAQSKGDSSQSMEKQVLNLKKR